MCSPIRFPPKGKRKPFTSPIFRQFKRGKRFCVSWLPPTTINGSGRSIIFFINRTPTPVFVHSGSVALVHSARATRQLAAQLDAHAVPRNSVRIAAISARAADADGRGWDRVAIAAEPSDAALIAAAHRLAIDP